MEVTRINFEKALTMACKSIDDADFLSFDTELTGLGRKGKNRHFQLDTPEERYAKIRNDVTEYTMIQFGLSTFQLDLTNKRVQTATYCFYLSGQTEACYRYDSSSLEFLATNGFDFNKLYKDGLPFMSLTEEKCLREKLKYTAFKKALQVKTTDSKEFFSKMMAKLRAMRISADKKLIIPFKSLSTFNRKLLFINIAIEFPSFLIETVNYSVEITAFNTVEEKEKFLAERFETELQKKIGFGLLGRKIMEAKKPIVGHNPQLDVFQFVDKIVTKLPEEYSHFKKLVSMNMPVVYDTKLIVKDPPFATKILNSALNNVYEDLHTTLSDLTLTVEPGCQSYMVGESTGPAHNAGYDAFMTGVCFLAMMKKLSGLSWLKKDPLQLSELKLYAYKLNLMFSHDIPYIDLIKEEVVPSRSNVFVVECPDTFDESDIKKCFSDLRFYKTFWVNDTKLYVVPQEPATLCLSKVTSKCPPQVTVTMYQPPIIADNESETMPNSKPQSAKHPLDRTDNLVNFRQCIKRAKNQVSAMSLNSPIDNTVKDHFALNDDWN